MFIHFHLITKTKVMTTIFATSARIPAGRHRGPHPGILSIVYSLLFLAGLIFFSILSRGASFPSPFGILEEAQRVYNDFPMAHRVNAFFQVTSAIPLGLFSAAVTSRLHFLGVTVTGVSIAVFGGITASVMLILSGLSGWILSYPGMADDLHVMHAVQLLGFGTGGFAFTAGLGLLMAGVSVPCLFGHYAPRWLAWLGLILAGLAEISTIGLLIPQLVWIFPIVRFPSMIWLIGSGFALIKDKAKAVV
jgi:hypothetical protein